MSNKNLLMLGLIAGITVFLAALLSGISNQPREAVPSSASYLIQGLDPDQVAKITIGSGTESEQVVLTRRGVNFVVSNKDNYPAMVSEINKLLTACMDIKTAELYTENPENFKDLDVSEDSARIIVKFYKQDSTPLTGVIVGKQRDKVSLGYVRRTDDNKVYIMATQVPWIKKRPVEYMDQQLTNLKREDIEYVTVSDLNDTYTLKPGVGERGVIIDKVPGGKKVNEPAANGVFTALAEMRFDDVNSAASLKDLKFDRKFVCRLKNSTLYTIPVASHGDNWFIKCDATFMDISPVTKTQGQVESEEALKKKEEKLLARDAAEEFSEKHQGWVYQISHYQAENLTKPLSALLEDITPAVESNKENGDAEPAEETEPANIKHI